MLDIKTIRERSHWVKERLNTRGESYDSKIDIIIKLDSERRSKITHLEAERNMHNMLSKKFGILVEKAKTEDIKTAEEHKRKARELDQEVTMLNTKLITYRMELPNLPDPSVPIGNSEEANHIIREWGEKKTFTSFTPENHITLCNRLGLIDFKRGAKLSGNGFLLYTHWGARLERALTQFLLDLHTYKHAYKEVSPPYMVNRECMEGVGQFPKFIDQAYTTYKDTYKDESDPLYLIPTAEAPVANIHRQEMLSETDLPIYYCAYSPCFRAEAGAAGVGTRGMIRVHQFDKVELIKIVSPQSSYDELETLICDAEKVLQLLGLHYRIVLLCTGDMSFASAKTYDIEVWAPGQNSYLEVSSCSNCEDFQSRRMKLRYKTKDGTKVFPHILNGSGTALARLFVAIIETYQCKDGSISIPKALQNYMKAERIPAV